MQRIEAIKKLLAGKEVRPTFWGSTYLRYDKVKNRLVNGWDEWQSWGIFDLATEWEMFPEEKEPTP